MKKYFLTIFSALALLLPGVSFWTLVWGHGKCDLVVSRLAKGENLTEADYKTLGFKTTQQANFEKALVLPMNDTEWDTARKAITKNSNDIRKDFSYLKVDSSGAGVTSSGKTFLFKGTRKFEVAIIEKVQRGPAGEVSHYVSLNVREIKEDGSVVKLAYTDGPHVTRNEALWFHAHDADSGEVIQQLGTRGFDHSVIPDVMNWAGDWVSKLP